MTNLRGICLPHSLACDGINSCEVHLARNKDWDGRCGGSCFDFGYIVMRSVIAILFVMIPTVIVFVLFYRRQLTLQRQRALRDHENRRRSISVISADDWRFASDVPPTYDDIYETKDPPPCFCTAVTTSTSSSPCTPSTAAESMQMTSMPSTDPDFRCSCSTSIPGDEPGPQGSVSGLDEQDTGTYTSSTSTEAESDDDEKETRN